MTRTGMSSEDEGDGQCVRTRQGCRMDVVLNKVL